MKFFRWFLGETIILNYNGLDLTDKLYTDKYMCFHGIFVINNYTSLGYF
jgi:hypothetical protein